MSLRWNAFDVDQSQDHKVHDKGKIFYNWIGMDNQLHGNQRDVISHSCPTFNDSFYKLPL